MTEKIRGRFAPSPSGRMHLGNVFCALLAWLSAKSAGGEIVLRIEDIDPRCKLEYAAQLEDDLRWLGLFWDEGGIRGPGHYGPYIQSRREEVYQVLFQKFKNKNLLYPCFCSREGLHAASAPHSTDGVFVYPSTCRSLTPQQIAEKSQHRRPAMRLKVPEKNVTFTDGCRGLVCENLKADCGDFILRRSDGIYAYQLAVVADDALMGISQVVRGRDLLSSTPRQLYLYKQLGFQAPEFYHIPLLVAEDGRRLSKRDHDLDMGFLRERFSPQEILGWLAFLAGLMDHFTPAATDELLRRFSWDRVRKEDIVLSPLPSS